MYYVVPMKMSDAMSETVSRHTKVTFLKQMQASNAARLINRYERRGLSLGHPFSSWGSLSLRAARSICIFVNPLLQLSGKS